MLTPASCHASEPLQLSRRATLATSVALVAATAGCTGFFDDETEETDEEIAAAAPAQTTVLAHLDVEAVDAEAAVQTLEELAAADPGSLIGTVTNFEARTGLDPLEATELLVVDDGAASGDEPSDGDIILDTDWNEDTVVASLEETTGSEYEQTAYEDEPVLYRPADASGGDLDGSDDEPDSLGVLGAGRFIVGNEETVHSSLEVQYGAGDSLTGPVRDAYDDARGTQVTVASVPSRSLLPVERLANIPFINGAVVDAIEAVGQRCAVSDAGVTLEFACHVTNESDAEELEGLLNTLLLVLLDGEGGDLLPGSELEDVDLAAIDADDIDLERDGSVVEVAYEGEAEVIVGLLDGV